MSDEFPDISSKLPDMATVIAQRIAAKKGETPANTGGKLDPYQLMLNKKNGVEPTPEPIQKWPEGDVKQLQDYCTKMGIVGFNSGKMHPIAALAMLKQQFGEDFSGVPLEKRVPAGYEALGTKSKYGPNAPYESTVKMKKQILLG